MSEDSRYLIRRTPAPVRLAAEEAAWESADRLTIDQYPWYKAGDKQRTTVALLYDDQAIYALFVCEDKHIYSEETRPNGNVYKDSCVEFFGSIDPARGYDYFNFEANACGVVHLGFGPGRQGRRLADPQVHKALEVVTSIPTDTWPGSPNDDGWWLAARLPFAAIARLAGATVAPKPGDLWRANFFRCGGKISDQYACWSPIQWDHPDFHRPEFFGELKFE